MTFARQTSVTDESLHEVEPRLQAEHRPKAVIRAKAGIHFDVPHQSNMDSRFRANDGHEVAGNDGHDVTGHAAPGSAGREVSGTEEYLSLQVIGRLLLIAQPSWS